MPRKIVFPLKIKNKKKIYFLGWEGGEGNTNSISSHVLKISAVSLVLCTREITDIFNTFDEINLVFTSKKVNSKYPIYIRELNYLTMNDNFEAGPRSAIGRAPDS